MTLGGGALKYISHKQYINTQSSTGDEIFGSDNAYTMIIWTLLILKDQVYNIDNNIL